MQKNILEFERQVNNLLEKGYPDLAGLSESEFLKLIDPLKGKISQLPDSDPDFEEGYLPFVIVVKSSLILSEKMMQKVEWNKKNGIIKLDPKTVDDFYVIEGVTIPESPIYLLIDIDRRKELINVTPENALKEMIVKNRSPLTIDEGLAVITHYPEFLIKNNCFSLLASRAGDQKVPAIWISEKAPKLGWCWDRNPHTWLGSASAKNRY